MSIYQIVFSPTGNTQKAADMLAAALGEDIKQIDISAPNFDAADVTLGKEDIAVLAVPVFGGRLPLAAAERLAGCRGNGAKAVLLCVYGNRAYDDALIELYDIAVAGGFSVVAAVTAVSENSIARGIGIGRPNAEDEAALKSYGQRILEKITAGDTSLPQIPGCRPYRKRANLHLAPKASSACNGCGLCAEKCPTGAIDKNNPHHTNKAACQSCMRCVSLCPQKARSLNWLLTGAAYWGLKIICPRQKECELFI